RSVRGAAPETLPVRLKAGEETSIGADGVVALPRPANVDPVKSWSERRLTFINEPLADIAEEFNRYNRTPRIRIGDTAAGELKFRAAFEADDPESLTGVLQTKPGLVVERQGEEMVILSRKPKSSR